MCTTLAMSASAAWTLVDDFSTDTVASGAWEYDVNPETDTTAYVAVENGTLAAYPGTPGEDTLNMVADTPMPEGIAIDGVGTVFLQVRQPMVDGTKGQIDTVWGITDLDENVNRYADFMALMRVEYDESFDVYEGTTIDGSTVGYQTVLADGVGFTGDVWYNIWIVVDNTSTTNPGGFKVYMQGGTEYPTQTLVYPDPNIADSDPDEDGLAGFRRPLGFDPIDNFRILTSAGRTTDVLKGQDPTYFDNIYVDAGSVNLDNPVDGGSQNMGPGIFSDYVEDENGNVMTGDWMGAVYVTEYPWVWSYDLTKWVYVPDADGNLTAEQGVWIYASRPQQ